MNNYKRRASLNSTIISDLYDFVPVPKTSNRTDPAWEKFVMFQSKARGRIVFPNEIHCKACADLHKKKSYSINTSITNIKRHLILEHGYEDPGSQNSGHAFNNIEKLNTFDPQYRNKLARVIAKMCALDFLPFNIVSGRGFQNFCL